MQYPKYNTKRPAIALIGYVRKIYFMIVIIIEKQSRIKYDFIYLKLPKPENNNLLSRKELFS